MTYQPRTCGSCNGTKGRVETTSDGKTTRTAWQPCQPCGGTGVR